MNQEIPGKEIRMTQRGLFPPSFCNWRLLLGVAVVTQLSIMLIALGALEQVSQVWLGLVSLYGQALALFCALSVCIGRAWIQRLSSGDAWITAWLIAFIAAIAFSYITGVVGTVLGLGPGRDMLADFMLKSVLAVSLVSIALFRYLFIRSQWEAETLAKAEASVQALQARIRPHFLFNSLNTIASLVPDDPEGAERATEDLADLFRGGMQRVDQLIRLEDELHLARKYLDMEQRRLGDRLTVEWAVDELPPGAAVLPLILQPLLENAVGHGIQSRTEGGKIRVYGRKEDQNVVITITNPLAGESARQGHGMALRNIRQRLELEFGGRASLITSQDDEYFYAVLSVPHVTNTDH